jgi:Trk K+ transport system NAD-binding subunit
MAAKVIKARIEAKGEIVGKKINQIQKKYGIKVLQLENLEDRIIPFCWERPPHNRIVKEEDTLTILGKQNLIEKLYKN